MIAAGQSILASDFINSSTGAANAAMAVKTNADGQIDNSFVAPFRTLPLGEAFTGGTTPQPALILNDLFQPLFTGMSYMGMIGSPQASKAAIRIIPRTTITAQSMYAILGKQGGAHVDNAQISIQTDSAGLPSGTVITNGTSVAITPASLNANPCNTKLVTWASVWTLNAGTTYWIVFERTGALNDTNYYYVGGCVTSGNGYDYASFQSKYYVGAMPGGSWITSTYNNLPYFEIIPITGHGFSLWQAEADAAQVNGVNTLMSHAMGICITTGSAGASGKIIQHGVANGFSGLVPGAEYYVSTTKGAVSLTPQGQFLGYAMSATQMFIPFTPKIGTQYNFQSLRAGTLNATSGLIFHFPFNGTLIASLGASSSGTIMISDDLAGGQNNIGWSTISTPAGGATQMIISIPIRKGQWMSVQTGLIVSVLSFIPEF